MIGFAQIIGGKPSSVGGMTDHLMNKTLALGSEDERLALYYGRGQISVTLQELARAVADGSLRFSEAVEAAMSEHIGAGGDLDTLDGRREADSGRQALSSGRTGAAGFAQAQ